MELDLQSLSGLHVTCCAQLFSWDETLQAPFPRIWAHKTRGAISQLRKTTSPSNPLVYIIHTYVHCILYQVYM
jgi:hypothetical protein